MDSASVHAVRERAGWRALNTAIRSGRVQAVAFWKLDRTHRVASQCLEWLAECHRREVVLISHQDGREELNGIGAGAKLVTGVKALLAEAETDSMSERQRAAKRHGAQAGFFGGGRRPFGWQPGPRLVDAAGRSGRRLEPHPVEHPALQVAVAMVLSGAGLRAVAVRWHEQFTITGPHGGLVGEQVVRRALTSPRMLGYRLHHVPTDRPVAGWTCWSMSCVTVVVCRWWRRSRCVTWSPGSASSWCSPPGRRGHGPGGAVGPGC